MNDSFQNEVSQQNKVQLMNIGNKFKNLSKLAEDLKQPHFLKQFKKAFTNLSEE